jgi:hypothetical protein
LPNSTTPNSCARSEPASQTAAFGISEDTVDGLDKAPEAFIGMLDGRNFGKLIVRVEATP